MDDNAKQVSSYQLDQEILDARGISMTVEEVAGLPTCKYAERVSALRLPDADLAFLKGLRRRIKNRVASQNSRRRSVEQLRRLTRELRAVRARRAAALQERRSLVLQLDTTRAACLRLRQHVVHVLQSRSDPTEVPTLDPVRTPESQPQPKDAPKKVTVSETKTPLLSDCFKEVKDNKIERDKHIFECRIDKIVQNSVNHMYNKKKIFAKTVFISNEKLLNGKVSQPDIEGDGKSIECREEDGVLNLSVKQEKRRSHGRKQSAPRRIPYACLGGLDSEDVVLDLKIKKETP